MKYLLAIIICCAGPLAAQDSTLWGVTYARATSLPANVKNFGAKCDGATNDKAAIQRAVDSVAAAGGGVLLFPRGTCLLAGTIRSPTAPIVFQGMGRASTILKWTVDSSGILVTAAGSVVRDLTLRGIGDTAIAGAGFGINSGNATNITIEDCIIEQWRNGGINTGGDGSFWLITKNIVRNNNADGIFIAARTSNSIVSSNVVQNNGANGIDINGSANLIANNTVTNNGLKHTIYTADTWGILIQAVSQAPDTTHADRNVIVGNVVYAHARGSGIDIRGDGAYHANFTIVESNHVYQNVDGIQVDGSATGPVEGTLVVGNITNSNVRFGIGVSTNNATPTRTRIANNIATGDSMGIFLAFPTETTVIDNTLYGNILPFVDLGSTQTVRAGNRLKSGSTALLTGRKVLSAGTGTVTSTEVQANDNILLTNVINGGTAGFLRVSAIAVGSFTIKSSSTLDTSTIYWEIVH